MSQYVSRSMSQFVSRSMYQYVSRSMYQYVSRLVNSYFSKMSRRIFQKFYMKLAGLNRQKLTKPSFLENFFFSFCQKLIPLMCLFLPKKWCIIVFFMILQKPLVWEKSPLMA